MIDYHVHLWRHTPHLSLQASVDQLAGYCAQAARLGVAELAVTEHSSRFRQVDALVRGWWEQDPSPERRAETYTCWGQELDARARRRTQLRRLAQALRRAVPSPRAACPFP